MTWYYGTVSKNTEAARDYHVRLPRESFNGSHFGSCTCGVPSKEGLPCKHMVVMVKSSVIPTLTRINIMPHYWGTAHWQMRYPLELDCETNMTIKTVKAVAWPNEFLRYCPDWSAPKKSGRPQKSDKVLTVTEQIALSSSNKKRNPGLSNSAKSATSLIIQLCSASKIQSTTIWTLSWRVCSLVMMKMVERVQCKWC